MYLHVNCVVLTFRKQINIDLTQKDQNNTIIIYYINIRVCVKNFTKIFTQENIYKNIKCFLPCIYIELFVFLIYIS